MAKRLTDTDKWKKPFIRTMKAPYKLLWLYILDECDHAGIWQVDFEVAQLKIGEKLREQEALLSFGNKILVFDQGQKWFIFDFIEFQYGELNPSNRAHFSVLTKLSKYNIDPKNKPLASPLQGAMDMDKEKDMDKVKDKGGKKVQIPSEEEFLQYAKEVLTDKYPEHEYPLKVKYATFIDNGWRDGYNNPIKNWKLKLKTIIPFLKPTKINGTAKNQYEANPGTGFGAL